MKSRSFASREGLEGALLVFSPFALVFSWPGVESGLPATWRLCLSVLSTALWFGCALTIRRRPEWGKWIGIGAALAGYGAASPYLFARPFAALAASVCLIYTAYFIFGLDASPTGRDANKENRRLERAKWSLWAATAVTVFSTLFVSAVDVLPMYFAAATWMLSQFLFFQWAVTIRSKWRMACSVVGVAGVMALLPAHSPALLTGLILVLNTFYLLTMPRSQPDPLIYQEPWWDILVDRPGRILVTTFLTLCFLGSLLLLLPVSTEKAAISWIDAVFTAVSAVCVTGLIVLDTPQDFTLLGQGFILILIQLGGLGIMSITTLALHVMGRRLSLRHEKILTSMTNTSRQDLIRSLGLIVKFTFIAEGLGALLLITAFYFTGDPPAMAIWRGVFTAVSAFCNAGFALQSDSLISYQANPLVLHTVAFLIISGGMAPATSLVIPAWVSGKKVPITARIALVGSVVLLFFGTFFLMAFEWNGVLAGLTPADKFQNAWFQSVTLRTAGFNSVDISAISNPAFLIMLLFMFIGGSPGGTAGGVKTTTMGILAMTFWTNISNKVELVIQSRRIHQETVYRAMTVVAGGGLVWFLVVMMLEVTQGVSSRDLIFEATSAVGTVGLSTGATARLDEIGKVIIIFAMFAGRIGPISLFMLLADRKTESANRHPVERITIT